MELANRPVLLPASRLRSAIASLWKHAQRLARREPKRLRLCESLALGDRRFVAVIEFEGARFLLGGTANSLVLLSPLGESREETKEKARLFSNHGQETINQQWEHTC